MIKIAKSIQSVLLGFTCACLFATPVHATTIDAGFDLFQTTTTTHFLGVDFEGVPLGTFDFGSGAVGTGDTDTIIRRLDPATVPATPATAPTIDIELVALQLRTVAPVDFGLGLDFYFRTLNNAPSLGEMDITFQNPMGGGYWIGI